MAEQLFFKDEVRIGKKGQITIPKKIRDIDGLKEDDLLIITHMPSGDIMIKKTQRRTPEDDLLEFIKTNPPFDAKKAWKEIKEERRRADD